VAQAYQSGWLQTLRQLTMLLAVKVALLVLVHPSDGHGVMMEPEPRQPEAMFWYQVGCAIGCTCTGGGKESYPSLASMNCTKPGVPTLTKASELTWNADNKSPKGEWNKYMPWRAPGTAKPLDSCGIASGFAPDAAVQFPHSFAKGYDGKQIMQGMKGTDLPAGKVTVWKADSVVKATYRLLVNHGGGYQYRVCPKTESPTESCFHANPLAFANGKTTVVYSTGKKISLNAVDVIKGVHPAGHAWRRLPIPACNCDFGTSCHNDTKSSSKSQISSFNEAYKALSSNKAHGHCTFGLQFQAQHITDGSWPDGYGYYVSKLGTETAKPASKPAAKPASKTPTKTITCGDYKNKTTCDSSGKGACTWNAGSKNICSMTASKSVAKSTCGSHKDKAACDKATCTWYDSASKSVCYGTPGTTVKGKTSAGACMDLKNQTACAAADAKSACKWHAPKKVCYAEKDTMANTTKVTGFSGTGTTDAAVYQWWVEDELKAPSKLGDYILQWRWDNEQTPQVWTTCADITVTNKVASPASGASKFAAASHMLQVLLVAAAAVTW